MITYKTDDKCAELFENFMAIKRRAEFAAAKIQSVASIVQNQDIEITQDQYYEWEDRLRHSKNDFMALTEDLVKAWFEVRDYLVERMVEGDQP